MKHPLRQQWHDPSNNETSKKKKKWKKKNVYNRTSQNFQHRSPILCLWTTTTGRTTTYTTTTVLLLFFMNVCLMGIPQTLSFHLHRSVPTTVSPCWIRSNEEKRICVVLSGISSGDSGGDSSSSSSSSSSSYEGGSTGSDVSFSTSDTAVVDADTTTVVVDSMEASSSSSPSSSSTVNPQTDTTSLSSDDSVESEHNNVRTTQSESDKDSSSLIDHPFFVTPVHTRPSTMTQHHNETIVEQAKRGIMSRRAAFQYGSILVTGSFLATMASQKTAYILPDQKIPQKPKPSTSLIPQPILKKKNHEETTTATTKSNSSPSKTIHSEEKKIFPSLNNTTKTTGRLEPINFTQVASETNINVTLSCEKGCISVDSKNFTKVQTARIPSWFPSWLKRAPPAKVVKQISDPELLVASTVAGASMEMFRTGLLYPLSTIKVRVQQDRHNFTRRPPPLSEKIVTLGTNVQEKIQEGNLYAGIAPTLLVSVPATGVYYGIRDVTKRMLTMTPLGDTWIAVTGAFVGDVVSLCFRTPADALALRLQAQNKTVGDWLGDSLARLPMVIATDLPYLLSKVVLNRWFIHGSLSVDQYAELAVFTAVIAAFVTTPFDVARTRILLDKQLTLIDDSNTKTEDTMIWDAHVDTESETTKLDETDSTMIWDTHVDAELEEAESNTPAIASTRPGYSVLQTMIQITKEGEGGVANLFAGWLERVLYLGIGRAWLEPVQLIGYIGIRDAVLLEWF
ncbi:mitochondrial carrier protein [Nitzschia inconspicua]|uniref:Mitochondrial carrier protein n=1 Tax=Nitzschia inconspicua TaxID=303405 RepID=A0A9K3PY20_9STRA|nr:mitochondrial carrier protein [Nitzschia inconspicua]